MKIPLIAALVLFPGVVIAADAPNQVPNFKFELPPLKLAEALRQVPPGLAGRLAQTPLTLSNANPIPAPPVPAALLAAPAPGKTAILVPKNVDPHMPIKKPDATIDLKILVPAPATKSGK